MRVSAADYYVDLPFARPCKALQKSMQGLARPCKRPCLNEARKNSKERLNIIFLKVMICFFADYRLAMSPHNDIVENKLNEKALFCTKKNGVVCIEGCTFKCNISSI